MYHKPLVYTDDGWLAREIFVVNIGDRLPAKFTYTYESAAALTVSMLALSMLSAY